MKKWFSILFCLALAASFLSTSIGAVQADAQAGAWRTVRPE